MAHVAGMSGRLPELADGLSVTWPGTTRQAVASCGFCLPDDSAEEMTVVISRASRTLALGVLLAGRISHYSSVMIREKAESFLSAAEWQHYFEQWLGYYAVPWGHGTSPSEFAFVVTVGRKARSPLGTLDLTIAISAVDDPQYVRVTHQLTSWRLLANAAVTAET
jgi:predicted component of type VI protein secretion system